MRELNEGSKYLEETYDKNEYFRLHNRMQPLAHKLITGGPEGKTTHNVACYVCFDEPAVYNGVFFEPCIKCTEKGYRIINIHKWNCIEKFFVRFRK